MRRRTRWIVVATLSALLLSAGVVVVVTDTMRFRDAQERVLRATCLQRVLVFEEYAERWIVRNQLDALEASAQLLLLGNATYINVVVGSQTLLSIADRDSSFTPELLDQVEGILQQAVVSVLPNIDVDVLAPITLAGYPESPIGRIRMGFSGGGLRDLCQRRVLVNGGIALGSWLLVSALVAIGAAGVGRRGERSCESAVVLRCGFLSIDTERCLASYDERPLDLTRKLYELLLLFARSPERIFSDKDLIEALWQDSEYAASGDVKQHIYLLRKSIRAVHPDPKAVIENVKGFGYRLNPDALEGCLMLDS